MDVRGVGHPNTSFQNFLQNFLGIRVRGGGAPGERARTVEFFDRENSRLSTLDRANDQGERTPMMKLMAAKERLDLGLKWPTVSQTSGSEASSSLMVAVVVGGLVTVVVVVVI